MTRSNEEGHLLCEKCGRYKETVKLQPKIWHNYLQEYLEAWICDDCLPKWSAKCPTAQR